MSFLWKLLRIFRICMRLRSRKSPLHSDFQPTSTYSYKDIKRKKQEKTIGHGFFLFFPLCRTKPQADVKVLAVIGKPTDREICQ